MKTKLLIVDDNKEFCDDLGLLLADEYQCHVSYDPENALTILDEKSIDAVLLDVDLGTDRDGLQLLQQLKRQQPYLPVVMITEDERVSTVVRAMQLGASGYVGKRPDLESLKTAVLTAIREAEITRDRDYYREEVDRGWTDIIGEGPAMKAVKADILRASEVKANVLITGESGTGKELIARAIHRHSDYASEPFVAINCAAIPKDLFESELFGHEKGSFTGAATRRIGRFEQARGGTLFLDEISEIPVGEQAKLLRVLQEKRFYRVGATEELETNARIVVSSNRILEDEVAIGKFREDLYFRLKVFEIAVPPLRARPEDIPDLVAFFVNKKAVEMKRPVPTIDMQSMENLRNYQWPGNVRELENCIESALVRDRGNHLKLPTAGRQNSMDIHSYSNYEEAKQHFIGQFQRNYIRAVLKDTDGNITQAAVKMGISRQGLMKMMKACGIH
ncbi:MAG TPA: sigma-54 dependent transcriptional regulator [candidate division Zixibacteria bacterium]|nr:sigma-54 dependent transcriptional regulator [candidate division Zixibacteria bacterium]